MSHVRRTFGLGAKIHENPPEWRWPNRSHSKCVKLKTQSVGKFTGNARKGLGLSVGLLVPPLPIGTPRRSLSYGPLPADLLTPPLWRCGVVTVLGGRWFLSAHKPCVSLQMGVDLFVLKNQPEKVTVTVEVDTPRKATTTSSSHEPW